MYDILQIADFKGQWRVTEDSAIRDTTGWKEMKMAARNQRYKGKKTMLGLFMKQPSFCSFKVTGTSGWKGETEE